MNDARFISAKLLLKMEKGAYSNIALGSVLSDENISKEEKDRITELFYGVTERKITLDYIISKYVKKGSKSLDAEVLTALRISLYEILYCDKIPDRASVNEGVDLCRKLKKSSAAGLVNAVLRNFLRDDKKYDLPKDEREALSVKYSVGTDVLDTLLNSLSILETEKLLEFSLLPSNMFIRVNTLKISPDELVKKLDEIGIKSRKCECLNTALEITDGKGKLLGSKLFKDGYFHVQDLSSQFCCEAVNPDEGDIIIDVCSSPGGKSFTLSEKMNGTGKIYALELHENRVNLINEGIKRLSLENITAKQNDGTIFNENIPLADKVLCDVLCSGLGVIRGKPEIKYKSMSEINALCDTQYKILETSSRYVKSGGFLIYSTCSVNKKENEEVCFKFLKLHPEFSCVSFSENIGNISESGMVTILPDYFGSDGFFICKMRKNNG